MTVNLFGVTSKPGNRITLACYPVRKKGTLTTVYKRQTLLQQFQFTKEHVNESLPDVESKIIQHPLINIIIDTNGVTKLLKNLNISKASGLDTISNSILKGCAEQLSPGLSAIFSAIPRFRLITYGLAQGKYFQRIPRYKKGTNTWLKTTARSHWLASPVRSLNAYADT